MKTAFLALAALLISLLLAEGVVRSLSPLRLGFEYRDGLFVLPAEFEYDPETLPTNSLGFHDLERGPKPGGVRRVALLGDSYVAARSVALPQTVGQRLEAHLQRLSGERWEVLAWGLPGAGQRQQLRWLRRHGPAAQPDVVVTLFLSLNDVRNNSAELTERFQEQAPDIVSVRPGAGRFPGHRAPLLLVEGSVLNQLISHRLAMARGTRRASDVPIDYGVYAVEQEPVWRDAWRETEALLRETRAAARGLGARYAIVSASTPLGVYGSEAGLERLLREYPPMRGRKWDLDGPDRRVARFSSWEGTPFLALEPHFRAEWSAGRRLHWKYDGHWNVEGNDVAGRLIAEFLLALPTSS